MPNGVIVPIPPGPPDPVWGSISQGLGDIVESLAALQNASLIENPNMRKVAEGKARDMIRKALKHVLKSTEQ